MSFFIHSASLVIVDCSNKIFANTYMVVTSHLKYKNFSSKKSKPTQNLSLELKLGIKTQMMKN